jgi:D-glycerate 3-kinase
MAEGAMAALMTREGLPPAYAATVDRCWWPLAVQIAAWHRAAGRPLLIGINGAQGSGKSTLCLFLEVLLKQQGLVAATLSIDDVYRTRADRAALAARIHPLFATRGPPGTHDLALATRTITALLTGSGRIAIPRFDKASDDRLPEATWPQIVAPLDILLFEGWCIGATPQPESALAQQINSVEALEDPDMAWRSHVNYALATDYAALFSRLDRLVMLRAPRFAAVQRWRHQQEMKLRARAGAAAGMDDTALTHFMALYERLTAHMLADLPARADVLFDLDENQAVAKVRGLG